MGGRAIGNRVTELEPDGLRGLKVWADGPEETAGHQKWPAGHLCPTTGQWDLVFKDRQKARWRQRSAGAG